VRDLDDLDSPIAIPHVAAEVESPDSDAAIERSV
jgi:hypothetical protein